MSNIRLGPLVSVSDSMIVWAFRYCIGRRSYAVSDCVDNILLGWDEISKKTRYLLHKEILEAIAAKRYGMEMDKEQWLRVVDRYNKDNERHK